MITRRVPGGASVIFATVASRPSTRSGGGPGPRALKISGAVAGLPVTFCAPSTLYGMLLAPIASVRSPTLRGTRFTDLDRAGDDFFTAAALLRRLYRARGGPQAEQSTETLAQATRTALSTVEKLLQVLEQLGYVRPLAGESAGRWRFIGNDEQLTLRPLFERLVLDPADTLALPNDAEGWVGARALDRIDLPLKELG